jgi:nitrate/nitrite-specific signal transduction histidine kinase
MLPVAYCSEGGSLEFDDGMAHLSAADVLQQCQTCAERWPENRTACSLVKFPQPESATKKIHCLKLARADQLYGILSLYLRDEAYPNDQEQLLLEMMANEITLALESHSLRSRELAMLNRLQQARRLSNLHNELAEALAGTVEALEVTGGVLFLVDRTTSELQLQAEVGQPLCDALSLVKGLAGGAGQAETPLIIGDLVQSGAVEIRSLLIAPLRVGKHILGSLVLWAVQPDAFNRRRAQLVATVAGQAALLIENNHLYLRGEHRAVLAERGRLAREIHDGLAQTLGYLKLRTAQINNWLEYGEDQQVKSGLDEVQQMLSEAYVDTREAIDGLRLSTQESNLQAWVQEIVSEFETLSGIPVNFMPAPDVSLSPEVHVQLQRIVQESFSNIRKHADATQAWLEWRQDDYWLILQIQDNGCGFDLNDIPPIERHGLRIMRERADLLDADFQVVSQEDKGAQIIVRLPLKEHVGEVNNE